MVIEIVILVLTAIVGIGTIIANLIILRCCMKLYTEYFKDRSMSNRKEKP